jgi:hypothetical protein
MSKAQVRTSKCWRVNAPTDFNRILAAMAFDFAASSLGYSIQLPDSCLSSVMIAVYGFTHQ